MPTKIERIRIVCPTCGGESLKLPCHMKHGHNHFCSRKCKNLSLYKNPVERFWNKVEKSPDGDGCWQWTGCFDTAGYGMLRISRKNQKAHRISYEIHHGAIPLNMQVLHRCDNRKCVNPAHLFLGTNLDNMMDKVKKQRQARGDTLGMKLSGELCGRAKLTWDKVAQIRNLRATELTLKEIAQQFSINSISTISEIINYKTWRGEHYGITQ